MLFFVELITSQCICGILEPSAGSPLLSLAWEYYGKVQHSFVAEQHTRGCAHISGRTQVLLCTTNLDHGCLGMMLTWRVFWCPFPRMLFPPHKP